MHFGMRCSTRKPSSHQGAAIMKACCTDAAKTEALLVQRKRKDISHPNPVLYHVEPGKKTRTDVGASSDTVFTQCVDLVLQRRVCRNNRFPVVLGIRVQKGKVKSPCFSCASLIRTAITPPMLLVGIEAEQTGVSVTSRNTEMTASVV